MKWMGAYMAGEAALAALLRTNFPGLDAARAGVNALVDEAAAAAGVPRGRVMLGGFSQGAMTALAAALAGPSKGLAGVTVLSGAPIDVDTAAARLKAAHAGLKVSLSIF